MPTFKLSPGAYNLTGRKFGRLTVGKCLGAVDGQRYGMVWQVTCDCGNKLKAQTRKLTLGDKQSCGCLRNDWLNQPAIKIAAKAARARRQAAGLPQQNITGKRIGKLVAIKYIGVNKFRNAIWHWQCDCGNITERSTDNLKSAKYKCCGCTQPLKAKVKPKLIRCVRKHGVIVLPKRKRHAKAV